MLIAANVLRTMQQAIANIEALYKMPHLADWERDVRARAIRAHAEREFDAWLEQRTMELCHES